LPVPFRPHYTGIVHDSTIFILFINFICFICPTSLGEDLQLDSNDTGPCGTEDVSSFLEEEPMNIGSRDKKKALAAGALVALASVQAGAARADDTAAEIRFLKARLKQLEEKVARQDKQIRGVAKLPAMPPETPIVCKDQPCPPLLPAPPPIFVSFKNGLKVESFDHDFSFKIGGRIFVDRSDRGETVRYATKLRYHERN
jgi:hypothetical protein